MLFTLKKLAGGLLMPLPFLLLLMATGLFLLWFSHWKITGKLIISAAWLCLLLLSLQPVADRLLLPLENHYPVWNGDENVNFIVVLGGGYTWDPEWAPSANLFGNSLPRVTEGIRQWRAHPNAKMIFTGGAAATNPKSSAAVAAAVAESLGVPATAIIQLDQPHDTQQETIAVRDVVGSQPFLLVTSANHMPRALNFFHQQGLFPTPAPANQLAITAALNSWEKILPSALWLSHSERVWYESLGQLWQHVSLKAIPIDTDKTTTATPHPQ